MKRRLRCLPISGKFARSSSTSCVIGLSALAAAVLLGVFCTRLDSIAEASSIVLFRNSFWTLKSTVAKGALRPAMANLPTNLRPSWMWWLRLAGMMLHKSNVRPRFVECINAFTAGIGNGPGATLESLTAQYAVATTGSTRRSSTRIRTSWRIFSSIPSSAASSRLEKEGMKTGTQPAMEREFCNAGGAVRAHARPAGLAPRDNTASPSPQRISCIRAGRNQAFRASSGVSFHGAHTSGRIPHGRNLGLAILLRDARDRPKTNPAEGESRPASGGISAPGRKMEDRFGAAVRQAKAVLNHSSACEKRHHRVRVSNRRQ